jgi:hypothetical protein
MVGHMKSLAAVATIVSCVTANAMADSYSIGANGINSSGLGLTGRGVSIGQVERLRPGKPGMDMPSKVNSLVQPAEVWHLNFPALADEFVGDHATWVAGVMISKDFEDSDMPPDMLAPAGVAPEAMLYSGAYALEEEEPTGPTPYSTVQTTAQRIATRNRDDENAANDVRAINMSFNILPIAPQDPSDGNAQLTLFVDWSARRHDVLYVVGGAQGTNANVIPTDNYNGITVASSTRSSGVFNRVDVSNNYDRDAAGPRTSVDIMAPGIGIELTGFGGTEPEDEGTSLATPHVVGTVALLQQYGESRFGTATARRHELMKSVLMNSADKIKDNGVEAPVGALLGMERTAEDRFFNNWFDSDAYSMDTVPIDHDMGAGHLNAKRAWQQFAAGEHEANGADVPLIGWDYGTTAGGSAVNKYSLDGMIDEGGFVSATLAWDRRITFQVDGDTPDEYDFGDVFQPWINTPPEFSFNRMFLYLVPAGAASTAQAVAQSISEVENLQHIFFPVPADGEYELWVQQLDEDQISDELSQDYALTWWAAGAEVAQQGDFNGDGVVNANDLSQWKGDFGIDGGSDADADGDTDGDDFLIWQRDLGGGAPTVTATEVVPEPAAWTLSIFCLLLLHRRNAHQAAKEDASQ